MYVERVCLIEEFIFFFQAEDGIREAQESRGLGDVYKRQDQLSGNAAAFTAGRLMLSGKRRERSGSPAGQPGASTIHLFHRQDNLLTQSFPC